MFLHESTPNLHYELTLEQRSLNMTDVIARKPTLCDNKKVGLASQIDVAHSSKQKACHCVL